MKSLLLLLLAGQFFFTPWLRADEAAARTAAVEDLLKAMHADEMMTNILAKQREAMTKMLPSLMPKDMPPAAVAQAQQMMPKVMDVVYKQLTWESLKPDMMQIYAEVFTESEIKEITAFYQSPIGQKLIEKMPELTTKSMQLMQKRMVTIMPELQKSIAETAKEAKAHAAAQSSPAASP